MQVAQSFKTTGRLSSTNKLHFTELHAMAMSASQSLKSEYLRLFEVLLQVEEQRTYEQFEVPSLYLYCVELLELSPQIAKDFVCVVRKSLEIPELGFAVRSQRLTISKARKICPVMTATESAKYVSEDAIEFKLGVDEEWIELLKQTKDLLSQKYKRAVNSEEALRMLMAEHCSKKDPVVKAERRVAASAKSIQRRFRVEPVRAAMARGSRSNERITKRHIPKAIVHLVNLRDQGQCTHTSARGKRCESKRWLHLHHINEFAKGGAHQFSNLEMLCAAHHKIRHMKVSRDT